MTDLKNEIEEMKKEFEEMTGFDSKHFPIFFTRIELSLQQEREKAVREFATKLLKVDWEEDYVDSGDVWNEPNTVDLATSFTPRQFKKFMEQFLKESTNVQE